MPVLQRPPVRNLALRAYASLVFGVMSVWRSYVTEEMQLSGMEHVPDAGPVLWMFKHESWHDVANIPLLWQKAGAPLFKSPSRRKYFPSHVLSEASRIALSPIMYEMHRTWLGEGTSEEEREAMREENRAALSALRENYERGFHILMAPEGSTISDGHITNVRPGAWHLSRLQRDNGIEVVRCAPIGLTYDFLSGRRRFGRKQHLVFANLGESFIPDTEQDADGFRERLRQDFISLSTMTCSMLAGDYLARSERVDEKELEELVAARATALDGMMDIDRGLLDSVKRARRVRHFYSAAEELGYVNGGSVVHERLALIPENPDWKHENVLRYTLNRLEDILAARPDVAKVIR